jgi:hypothetical protein
MVGNQFTAHVDYTTKELLVNAIKIMFHMMYFAVTYLLVFVLIPLVGTIYCAARVLAGLPTDELADTYAYFSMYHILGIEHTITNDAELIESGFCISNHRCFLDCLIEPYLSKSSIIIRGMSIAVVPFVVLFTYLTNVMLMINRGVDHRDAVYARCAEFLTASKDLPQNNYQRRITFYPEGSRMSYTELESVDDLRSKLKFGLLRSIYEAKQYPVQIVISNNKDTVIAEKWLMAQYGIKIRSVISKAIHPKDYLTMEAFFDDIVVTWYDCYRRTHDGLSKT